MKSAVVHALITSLLCAAGCAAPRAVLPAGADPRQLEATIARKAEEASAGEPAADSGASPLLGKCLAITAKVGLTCVVLSGCALCVFAAGGGAHGSFGDGVGQLLAAIWSSD